MNKTNNKINLAVIFGGASSEHEVSLMSATSVLNNIDNEKYNIYKIGITKNGEFFYYTGDIESIKTGDWEIHDCVPCVISPDRSHHGMIVFGEDLEVIQFDTVFPVLHGKYGEDGTIQGLLSLAGIPCVGCDMLSSACCMDKAITKSLFDNAGIPNAKWLSILLVDYKKNIQEYLTKVEGTLGFPCFVKPANAGSSVGVTKATDMASLEIALNLAFEHDKKALIEENINGLEIECAVIGNDEPIASLLGEIEPCNEFYDYDAKYLANKTKTYIPARIDEEITQSIRTIAIKAYKALGCSGLSRVDFFLTNDKKVILNEINTIPGFTAISMYPQLFCASGITYTNQIDRLIELSLERN